MRSRGFLSFGLLAAVLVGVALSAFPAGPALAQGGGKVGPAPRPVFEMPNLGDQLPELIRAARQEGLYSIGDGSESLLDDLGGAVEEVPLPPVLRKSKSADVGLRLAANTQCFLTPNQSSTYITSIKIGGTTSHNLRLLWETWTGCSRYFTGSETNCEPYVVVRVLYKQAIWQPSGWIVLNLLDEERTPIGCSVKRRDHAEVDLSRIYEWWDYGTYIWGVYIYSKTDWDAGNYNNMITSGGVQFYTSYWGGTNVTP